MISYNEELDIPHALSSLVGVADEIILVDSGSTDRTCEIACSFGVRVYARKFDGFAEQRNYGASLSSNDWILVIDCDHELSPELRSSLLAWKQQSPDKNGYEIPQLPSYLGGWIRHSGWYPEYKLLLYRRDKCKFDGAVHERVIVDGPTGRMNGHLFHYTMRSLSEQRAKLDAMTTMAADDMFARGRKKWRAAMIVAPPWTFVQRLVFQLGFLDGRRGWLIAWYAAKYIYVKYRKLGRLLRGETLARRAWPSPGGA